MAAKAVYRAAARDLVAAWRVRRRAEIQAEVDAYRDQRVQMMRADLDGLQAVLDALIAVAEGETTIDAVVNPPDPEVTP